ncbi:MAG: hypothetical protein IT578_03475 [Verrucomicrobiae bacterium]|nr:hypothetical protein [Verrucomicrobiae bacterium]
MGSRTPRPCRDSPSHEGLCGPKATVRAGAGVTAAAATLVLFGILNLRYVRAHGALATQGPDLWFYLLVARGWEPLSFLDVTRWLAAPAAGFSTAGGMAWFLALAACCNAASAFLLAARLEAFVPAFHNRPPGFGLRFSAGLLFALLPHQATLSVASFTHFTVGQLVLLGALQGFLPWLDGRRARPNLVAVACLAEAVVIGPEGVGVALWIALRFAWRRLAPRFERGRGIPSVLPGDKSQEKSLGNSTHPPKILVSFGRLDIALAGAVFAAWLFYEPLFRAWAHLALAVRGVNLVWQRQMLSGDLLPLGVSFFTIFHGINLLWIGLAIWHLRKGSKSLAWLAIGLAALSLRVFRPAFLLQLTGALLLLPFLASLCRPRRGWAVVLALFAAFTALPPPAPVFPHFLAAAAREIADVLPAERRIACSPTYGFFLEAWTRRLTTATMHRPDPLWAELAARPPKECARAMRDAEVGALWITTHDFRLTPDGYWSSSGLQETLQLLDNTAFKESVAVRIAREQDLMPLRCRTFVGRNEARVWCAFTR